MTTTTIPLALGAMMFGTTIDERTSFALLDRFVEAGGTWIDTADCYSFWASDTGFGGQSEAVLGRWLAANPGVRERVRLSTKVGAEPIGDGEWPASREGLSRRAIREAIAGSLERLGVDRVDLLWAHMEDRTTPIEETAETFSELVDEGVAVQLGASNHPAWRMERARAHAVAIGGTPFSALQLSRSLLVPRPGTRPAGQNHRFGLMSDEQVDFAVENGMDLWAYTPLLSGAYDNPAKTIDPVFDHPGSTARLGALDAVAAEVGATRGQVVLAWLTGGTTPILPILGGSRLEQLDAALTGVQLELTDDQRARLDAPA
ncbi:aldo/keto reductase [Agromyces sp. G08B096]|uniref:Aldo/keto reductase n=1 Tax=Agromyces sp. G08B096 TaxID=3156399 RepID=A0AAU7W8G2_9MICO